MDLRGFYKFTLVDYPGKIACIVFTAGCNFRCPYCHNAALVLDPHSQPRVTEAEVFNFLSTRTKLLDGVVISGGEPTLQGDLIDFCRKINAMGFKFKLDTNSSHPDVVFKLHREVGIDALGIDFKAPADRYNDLVNCDQPDLAANVFKVVRFALDNGIDADVRTTVHRRLLSIGDLEKMYSELCAAGTAHWTLQQFNPVEVIDDDLPGEATYSDGELIAIARKLGPDVRVRSLTGRIIE
ncbi:MAG: anaerobic ribonucleoside-triphosphate reductase activating protein [Victivallaceae bacterium]|nr:anaerobic ribonucleoside-triphosphate reductase activating protein [Victivallaceae bacterium]